ncbi:MAG: nucleoside kinase [Anaerotignaceae bacterium]
MKNTMSVTVHGENLEVEKGTTFYELSKKYENKFIAPIMMAKCGNELKELFDTVKEGVEIEFLDYTNQEGMRVYNRSVSFLMIKAVKNIFGNHTNILIEHSLNNNLYCEIKEQEIKLTQEVLDKISVRMKELVEENMAIEKITVSTDYAINLLQNMGMEDKAKLFKFRRASNVNLYKLGDIYDYFYGYMVTNTGCLGKFRLSLYDDGFLIEFPNSKDISTFNHTTNMDKIAKVFKEQAKWCNLMKVKNIADLNELITGNGFEELVLINEALHEKKIVEIAEEITKNKDRIKLVLIAGPSSSGKTTFAQRICIQLRVNGIMPHAIGLDDYFVNRENTCLDEDGLPDYESIKALDLDQFNADLNGLINGERVAMPSYNFVKGEREYRGRFLQLQKDEILVVEGIHGLNEELTKAIKDENKYKIFISAMTELNVDDHNRISTSDSRLIRRIVRDNQFRGNTAEVTIDGWASVRRGEERNIFPYQQNADIIFNSATIYELAVLKSYIEPLLFGIDRSQPEYITAKRIIKFFDYILPASCKFVPNNSIIKEFLGGSVFKT